MFTKKCALTLGGFAATMLICFITMHVMSLFTVSKWVGVSTGACVFAVMLALALIFRKNKKLPFVIIPLNAIGDGLALSSLFVYTGTFPQIWETAAVFGALLLAFVIYCLLTGLTFVRNHCIISMLIYCVLLLGALLTATFVNDIVEFHPAVIYLAYMSLIPFIAFFITTATFAENAIKQVRNMAYASFAALIIIIIVVLVVISQGEGLDGLADGIGGGTGGKGKDKRNPYDYYSDFPDNIPV